MLQFGPNMHNKGLSHSVYEWPQKEKTALIKADQQKQIVSLQKPFILQKYNFFGLNYESFSNWCEEFLVKKGSFLA